MTLAEARKNQIKDLEDQIKGLKAKLSLLEDAHGPPSRAGSDEGRVRKARA